MDTYLRVLLIDVKDGFYRINRYPVGDYFGPVDLGLHLAEKHGSLNFGVGLLAGSIFPGSNRMIFTGISPCWSGFYISSMGGAGLVFDNLGLNLVSLIGKAHQPSILYLNRIHGEEVEVDVIPVNLENIWQTGRQGLYALMDYTFERFGGRYLTDPRILSVGPAAAATDIGAVASVPIKNGVLSFVDTWAGRGGLGSKMLREHHIAAVIYGGTYIDEDFRDRRVADQWFIDRYEKKLAAKDLEATAKYRFDPKFDTGGTFGVNYASLGGKMFSFNYRSIFMTEAERLKIHQEFVLNHYLKQFNEETIQPKQQKTCGEPCVAVCKKMNNQFKKDYEPYQTLGPLSGIFDQRAAEALNHQADKYGFDAISVGGVVACLMECLVEGLLTPADVGTDKIPKFDPIGFDVVKDSQHNADVGCDILTAIIEKRGLLDLTDGARRWGKNIHKDRGLPILDRLVFNAFARDGWMPPNQYWTPGVLSPMSIMGKYYMYYGNEFLPPRKLGQQNADRFKKELILDNTGLCRFHRGWAEEMLPEIMESLYGMGALFLEKIAQTASRINARNSSCLWESERNTDLIYTFLKRKRDVDGVNDPELNHWLAFFETDRKEAAMSFWYEMHKGIQESLR